MAIDQLSLAVVGARYPNPRRKGRPTGDRQMEILLCAPGDPVVLEPEPDNPHDRHAIAVYSERGVQMGYIVADRTLFIRRAWEQGRAIRAIFQAASDGGCWIRVAFDGEPALPGDSGDTAPPPADHGAFDGIDDIPPDD
jgi:hypothetical protein